MDRKRLLIVFGTRPEAVKLFPVIRALERQPTLNLRVCVTGQHREMLDQVLDLVGIEPDVDLDLMTPGQSLDGLVARLLGGIGAVLDEQRPHRVIVQGDTASAMAAARAAYHRDIPVAHVEAGLRSGNLAHPWPEEGYRRAITGIADLHFAPTPGAAAALQGEDIDPACVYMTGNSGIDALLHIRAMLRDGRAKASVVAGLVARFAGRRVIAVTCHRRENLGELASIAEGIAALARRGDVAIILPLHPNPEIGAVFRARLGSLDNVALTPPLDYPDFVALLDACHFVLTDSGGIQEEAPALGKPVLVMRETTERPEGVAAGTAKLVGTDPVRIVAEAARLLEDRAAHAAMAHAHSPYGDGRAAERIAAILSDNAASHSGTLPLAETPSLARTIFELGLPFNGSKMGQI